MSKLNLKIMLLSIFTIFSVPIYADSIGSISGEFFTRQSQKKQRIVIKAADGSLIGKSLTVKTGKFSLPSDYAGLVIAEGVSVSGRKYYGIGRAGLVNITPFSDAVLRIWFQAQGKSIESEFQMLSVFSKIPSDYDVEDFIMDAFDGVTSYHGALYADFIHEPLSSASKAILRNSVVHSLKGLIKTRTGIKHYLSVRFTAQDDREGVRFRLESTGKRVGRPSRLVESTAQLSISQDFFKLIRTNGLEALYPNASWMGKDISIIGNKKLSDIAVPGTHDSGTSRISGGIGETARTQDNSIGQQLSDGIRYFDLRVLGINRYLGNHCPSGSDYYIFHNSDWNSLQNFTSFRLTEVLSDVKTFVGNPANKNEVVILDFQNLSYLSSSDLSPIPIEEYLDHWQARLFETVQAYLDGAIISTKSDWAKMSFEQISSLNVGDPNSGKIILLVDDKYIKSPVKSTLANCPGSIKQDLWFSRNQRINGLYLGRDAYWNGLRDDILSQLSESYAAERSRVDVFQKYQETQLAGYLNVLNFAPKPNTESYADMVVGRDHLTNYSEASVNKPFNTDELCNTGMIGKYAWAGNNIDSKLGVGSFNKANIIMIDKYNSSTDFWVNAAYDQATGVWRQDSLNDFVGFIRAVNKSNPYETNKLTTVPSMRDEACLVGSLINPSSASVQVDVFGPGNVTLSPRLSECIQYITPGLDYKTCTDKAVIGRVYRIKAVPDNGKSFNRWYGGGGLCDKAGPTCIFVINGDLSFKADFR